MDPRIFRILTILDQQGTGKLTNIAPLLNEFFPNPILPQGELYKDAFQSELNEISNFMGLLREKYINYSNEYSIQLRDIRKQRQGWQVFSAFITNEGVDALNKERDRHIATALNNSVRNTNRSMIIIYILSLAFTCANVYTGYQIYKSTKLNVDRQQIINLQSQITNLQLRINKLVSNRQDTTVHQMQKLKDKLK